MARKTNIEVTGLEEIGDLMKRFPRESEQAVKNTVKIKTLQVERSYTQNIRKQSKTGNTESQVDSVIINNGHTGIVFNASLIAWFLEVGTVAHFIVAKNSKVLTNNSGPGRKDGVDFFGTYVEHPGTSPKHHIKRAYLTNIGFGAVELIRELERQFSEIE